MVSTLREDVVLVVSFVVVLTLLGLLVIQESNVLDIMYFLVMFIGFVKFLHDLNKRC